MSQNLFHMRLHLRLPVKKQWPPLTQLIYSRGWSIFTCMFTFNNTKLYSTTNKILEGSNELKREHILSSILTISFRQHQMSILEIFKLDQMYFVIVRNKNLNNLSSTLFVPIISSVSPAEKILNILVFVISPNFKPINYTKKTLLEN